MADPIVIPGVPVPIPNPFDPNAPIFNPGGQTDPNNPRVDPLPGAPSAPAVPGGVDVDTPALVAIGQAYQKMTPAGQAKVYAGVKSVGGGKDAYQADWMKCAGVGLVVGLVAGFFVKSFV